MDKKTEVNQDSLVAVGRRKEAIARIRLIKSKSPLTVNGKLINEYFSSMIAQKLYQKPFEILGVWGQYSGNIKVTGGGFRSQLDAVVHGISRALAKQDGLTSRTPLKKAGLLTRDARVKERRKYGLAQKARAKKQSPKR